MESKIEGGRERNETGGKDRVGRKVRGKEENGENVTKYYF